MGPGFAGVSRSKDSDSRKSREMSEGNQSSYATGNRHSDRASGSTKGRSWKQEYSQESELVSI